MLQEEKAICTSPVKPLSIRKRSLTLFGSAVTNAALVGVLVNFAISQARQRPLSTRTMKLILQKTQQ